MGEHDQIMFRDHVLLFNNNKALLLLEKLEKK